MTDEDFQAEFLLRVLDGCPEKVVWTGERQASFNVAAFPETGGRKLAACVSESFDTAVAVAKRRGLQPAVCLDYLPLSDDLSAAMHGASYTRGRLDAMLEAITRIQGEAKRRNLPKYSNTRDPETRRLLRQTHEHYDVRKHASAIRYGLVELRVLQNYLMDRSAQKDALRAVCRMLDDSARMYAPAEARDHLAADDLQWNLRRLMTNAGFYCRADPEGAWAALEDWAERYLAALRTSNLIVCNVAVLHFLQVQRQLAHKDGYVPVYVRRPDTAEIYRNIAGKNVLFVTPMNHLVDAQISTRRLWSLYRDIAVPEFTIRTAPAWISTWPNRPHTDWSATFKLMCERIRQAYSDEPFDILIAACGGYGLPLCNFAREQFGCSVLYVGNIAHAAFGIRQKATQSLTVGNPNFEMWLDGDLGRFTNLHLIDDGKYV